MKNKRTTSETARHVGIHLSTLQRWIAERRISAPEATLIGAVGYRLWSKDDIERLKKVKESLYCKGRGRRKKPRD